MRYVYLVVVAITGIILMVRSLVYTQMNGYRLTIRGGMGRELLLAIGIMLGLEIVTAIMLSQAVDEYIVCIVCSSLVVIFTILSVHRGYKVKPNYTPRLRRLILVVSLLILIYHVIICILMALVYTGNVYMYIIGTSTCINYIWMMIALVICNIIENKRNKKYIKKCGDKLNEYPNIAVIGITGSFGKTSVKNILSTILSTKYNVAHTPASYNTPLGIAMSIDALKGNEDYFIVEMGARHEGDISELVRYVHPRYGIITGVTNQHIMTFHDIETIERTKYELYEGIPHDGLCVFNGNNESTCRMYEGSNSENSLLANDNVVCITNIKMNIDGMTFSLKIDDNERVCHTRLAGMHNIDNIRLAVAMANYLGISMDDIVDGISRLEQCPHRFEITQNNGIYIIDDAYNANIVGVESGINTLSEFKGRKIVATQGIVEGGKEQNALNEQVGILIGKCADIVVLIGKNACAIERGLIESDFNMTNVICVRSLNRAKQIFSALLRCGDILYITNDLPDNY